MKRVFALVALVSALGCGSEAGVPAPGSDAPPGSPDPVAADPPSTAGDPGAPAPGDVTEDPAPAPKLGAPYPIVLMHGMGGFGELEVGPIGITYFDGVVEDLTKHGEPVFVTVVPPYDTSEERAKDLAAQIDDILARTGKAKVNLVAHSQGGMDARVITSPAGLGYGDRVASVTTIATPHHGSRVADAVLGMIDGLPSALVDEITDTLLSLLEKTAYELKTDPHLRAQITELSETYMNTVFNPKYVDAPGVLYMSYAGRTNMRTGIGVCDDGVYPNHPLSLDVTQPALEPTALFLEAGSFEVNDGLVTVESAKWGVFQQCVPADHLKEVGQLPPLAGSFDHIQFFRDIVERVRDAGL